MQSNVIKSFLSIGAITAGLFTSTQAQATRECYIKPHEKTCSSSKGKFLKGQTMYYATYKKNTIKNATFCLMQVASPKDICILPFSVANVFGEYDIQRDGSYYVSVTLVDGEISSTKDKDGVHPKETVAAKWGTSQVSYPGW